MQTFQFDTMKQSVQFEENPNFIMLEQLLLETSSVCFTTQT